MTINAAAILSVLLTGIIFGWSMRVTWEWKRDPKPKRLKLPVAYAQRWRLDDGQTATVTSKSITNGKWICRLSSSPGEPVWLVEKWLRKHGELITDPKR